MSIIDLPSDKLRPALTALADSYESDPDNYIVPADLDQGEGEVEFIGTVDKPSSSSVGDAVINAMGTIISQSAVVFSNDQPHHSKKKRVRRTYHQRPDNWCIIADHYKVYKNVSATIKYFALKNDDVNKNHMYWVTTFGRWIKEMDKGSLSHQCGGKHPPYGVKIDLQLVDTVNNYNDHAVPMTKLPCIVSYHDLLEMIVIYANLMHLIERLKSNTSRKTHSCILGNHRPRVSRSSHCVVNIIIVVKRIFSLNSGKFYVMILGMDLHLMGSTSEFNEPLYAPTLLQTPAGLSAITVKIDKLNNNRVINAIHPLIAVAKTCWTIQHTIADY